MVIGVVEAGLNPNHTFFLKAMDGWYRLVSSPQGLLLFQPVSLLCADGAWASCDKLARVFLDLQSLG